MATYNKKLKTLGVHLMLNGQLISVADTATDDAATRALNEFKAYGTMHVKESAGHGEEYIEAYPYSTIQYIVVTEEETEISKADPYGCEETSEDDGEEGDGK